jgi:hypothetical protein
MEAPARKEDRGVRDSLAGRVAMAAFSYWKASLRLSVGAFRLRNRPVREALVALAARAVQVALADRAEVERYIAAAVAAARTARLELPAMLVRTEIPACREQSISPIFRRVARHMATDTVTCPSRHVTEALTRFPAGEIGLDAEEAPPPHS